MSEDDVYSAAKVCLWCLRPRMAEEQQEESDESERVSEPQEVGAAEVADEVAPECFEDLSHLYAEAPAGGNEEDSDASSVIGINY